MYLAAFSVAPLELVGVLEINKRVFGSTVVDVVLSQGVLAVSHSSKVVRLYSFENILQKYLRKKLVLGEQCEWNGVWGTVGKPPFGVPVNITIYESPTVLFEVSSFNNGVQIGGHPWHFIFTPNNKKQQGTHHICSLQDGALAKNGIQDMKCCSLESDWIYFHPDDSGRIIHVGPSQINVLKIQKLQEISSESEVVPEFSITAHRDNSLVHRPVISLSCDAVSHLLTVVVLRESGLPACTAPSAAAESGLPACTAPSAAAESGLPACTAPSAAAESGLPACTAPSAAGESGLPAQLLSQGSQHSLFPSQLQSQGSQHALLPEQLQSQGTQHALLPVRLQSQGSRHAVLYKELQSCGSQHAVLSEELQSQGSQHAAASQVSVTSSGRIVKRRFHQLDDDPEQETIRMVEYEDELDLLAVVEVIHSEEEGKAHVSLHDNQTGLLVKRVSLVESWDATYSHELFFDLDTIIHIEQKRNNQFCCHVYKITCRQPD
ncbi:hypothetical protein JZ751_028937 [Albula glossodonta]|uniref:Uncharacterized protein n=1 Tax=Albula glossodonta TaxID=121402 RepID=A0A8T2MVX7_9TELE|nr:hypothetical protein JZ751_028937 [Albula glossodonta]